MTDDETVARWTLKLANEEAGGGDPVATEMVRMWRELPEDEQRACLLLADRWATSTATWGDEVRAFGLALSQADRPGSLAKLREMTSRPSRRRS